MSFRKTCHYHAPFMGGNIYTSEVSHYGLFGWTNTNPTGSELGPTINEVDGGGVAIALDSQNLAEYVHLFMDDVLPFNVGNIENIFFEMYATGVTANTTIVCGFAGESSSYLASIADCVWFRATGSTALNVETRDGANNTEQAAGLTLSSTGYQQYDIDFTKGINDIRFLGDDGSHVRPIARRNTFTIANNPLGQFQFFARVEKTQSTDTPVLFVRSLDIEYRPN